MTSTAREVVVFGTLNTVRGGGSEFRAAHEQTSIYTRRKIMSEEKVRTEEIRTTGEELVAKVKELVHEGNIRRIIIKNEEGKTLIEVPLTLGVVGAMLLPVLAAVGAISALVADCTIVLEKVEE
jgi:hypothetical protein